MKNLPHVTLAHAGRILAVWVTVAGCGEGTGSEPAEPVTDNPVPTIRAISPVGVSADGKVMTFSINGTNFVRGSVVRWGGNDRVTGFHADTLLGAGLLASDVAVATVAAVTVFNPPPAGGTSNAASFSVLNPRSDGRKTVVFAFRLPAGHVGSIEAGGVSVGTGPVDITLDFSGDYVILACVGQGIACSPTGGRPGTTTINFSAGYVRARVYFNANYSQPPGDAVGTVTFTFNPS
jgi:hypothetical protein